MTDAEKVVDIASGHGVSVALTDDGTVWTWGYEWHGVLGRALSKTDPVTDKSTPKPVMVNGTTLTGVKDIAAGYAHMLALKKDGTVTAWGYNNYGQLGDGTNADSAITVGYDTMIVPVQVMGLDHVKAIDAGLLYSIALKEDGTVWAWGYNKYGQLGSGQFTRYESTPVQVAGLGNIVNIYAGYNHNIAIDSAGNVWAWGSNNCGELGDGTNVSRCTPVRISCISGAKDIAPGSSYTIALKSDGTVTAWGENFGGWLGDGTSSSTTSPVTVKGLDHVTAIATGEGVSFASSDDSTVTAWGFNTAGLVGNGLRDQKVYQPGKAGNMKGIVKFAVAPTHVLGLKADGSLWAWGDNQFGEIGVGKADDKTYKPLKVSLGEVAQATPGQAAATVTANRTGDDSATPSARGSGNYVLMGVAVLAGLVALTAAVIWYSKK